MNSTETPSDETQADDGLQSTTPIAQEQIVPADVKKARADWGLASRPHSRPRLYTTLVIGSCLLVLGGVGAFYHTRALPGVQLAGVPVANSSVSTLERVAKQRAEAVTLAFTTKDGHSTAKPSTAGITIDVHKTAQLAAAAKRETLLERVFFWRIENVPLQYKMNKIALQAYLEKNVIKGWKLPKDADIKFNPQTKQYEVIAPVAGEGVHMFQVTSALDKGMERPGTITISIQPTPTNAIIGKAAAEKAQSTANMLLKSDIKMMQNGRRVFYLEPQEIDTLIDIIPQPEKSAIEVRINPERVQAFVDTDITNTIARASRDGVALVNPTTGEKLVLQQGQPGQKLTASKQLAAQITEALKTGKPIAPEITVEEGGYSEKVFTGVNRWAEVNLTQQMAYMHLDDQVIQSFRISSGRAATPSDPGEWKVYLKRALHTMRGTINGESYVVPNVPWITYFNDGEAFHGAYWHNNFGTPMSHGCINMTLPDAQMMYNFSYIGMRVSVHY